MGKHFAQAIVISLISTSAVFSQPTLSSRNAAVNSASYRTPGLPGSGIAQGSVFTVFGTGLGPDPYVQAEAFPLPTRLSGASLTVTVGGTSTEAIILLAWTRQVNAILPSTTPAGSGTFTVTYNGQTSAPAPIQVVSRAFGIYTFNSSGSGQAIATDLNYQINSIIRTFHPGDYGILWGTGLGAISASDATAPPVGNLPGAIKVYVGDSTAPVAYQGRSGCCAGLDQIVFQVPAGVEGCHVPIAVEAGGAISNITTIAVSGSGQTCSDSVMGQDLVNQLASGSKVDFGYVRLESLIAPFLPGSAAYASADFAYGTFSEYTPQTAGRAQYGVSSGYCIAVDCSYGCRTNGFAGSLADSSPAQLDAGGSLTVQGQSSAAMAGRFGFYGAQLNPNSSRFLWSGLSYTVSGAGGANVGSFSVAETSGVAGVQFDGIKTGQGLPRSGDLTLQWTGGEPKLQNGQVTIGAYSGNDDLSQWVWLQCTAPVSPHKFTIPGWVLSTLPPSGSGLNGTTPYPQGWVWIGQYNNPVPFQATGLDRGVITDAFFNGFGVYFQ